MQIVKKNKAGLTLAGQQSIQGLGPLFQLFSTDAPLLTVAHLTPLTHEEQARPPFCSTVDPDHIRREAADVNEPLYQKILLSSDLKTRVPAICS